MINTHRQAAFISCAAQDDNLGDLVLRRTAVRWIEEAGLTPHVLTASVSDHFVEGLQLPDDAVIYPSARHWLRALAVHSRREPTVLVYAPGPQTMVLSLTDLGRSTINAALAVHLRHHQGSVVKLGRAIESRSSIMLRFERFLAHRSSLYTVRDFESRRLVGESKIMVEPDLAWAAGLETELIDTTDRHRLALSFRADRSFDHEAISGLVSLARDRDLQPTFVTQVRRDAGVHQELAEEFGCEHLNWSPKRDDTMHLAEVMRTYQQSKAVISNRLHSLIFGMTAGAIPLGLRAPGDTKLARTLAVVGLEDHVIAIGSSIPEPLWEADISAAVANAQNRLTAVQSTFNAAVGSSRVAGELIAED